MLFICDFWRENLNKHYLSVLNKIKTPPNGENRNYE